jgi:hypothetical protein
MLAFIMFYLLSYLAFSVVRLLLLCRVVAFFVGWNSSLESIPRLLLGDLLLQVLCDFRILEEFFQLWYGDIFTQLLSLNVWLDRLNVLLSDFGSSRISIEATRNLIFVCWHRLENVVQRGFLYWKTRIPSRSALSLLFLAQILNCLLHTLVLLFWLGGFLVCELGRFWRFGWRIRVLLVQVVVDIVLPTLQVRILCQLAL